jgi:hypothetical protein
VSCAAVPAGKHQGAQAGAERGGSGGWGVSWAVVPALGNCLQQAAGSCCRIVTSRVQSMTVWMQGGACARAAVAERRAFVLKKPTVKLLILGC